MSSLIGLTRREFLKLSAAGTAALTLGGCGNGEGRRLTTAPSTSSIFRVDRVPDLPGELPDPPGFVHPGLDGGAPVNSLRQYLTTTSLALHGEVRLDDSFVDHVRTSL